MKNYNWQIHRSRTIKTVRRGRSYDLRRSQYQRPRRHSTIITHPNKRFGTNTNTYNKILVNAILLAGLLQQNNHNERQIYKSI